MKSILFFNYKGGVGKTSLATAYALTFNKPIITNDTTFNPENLGFKKYIKLDESKKTIPDSVLQDQSVFDMGAMSGSMDFKTLSAIKNSESIIIPTLIDANSINLTIKTIQEAVEYIDRKNIFVIFNRIVPNKAKLLYYKAYAEIAKHIEESNIFKMKETTLYTRLANDGATLLHLLFNDKGVAQLKQTIEYQKKIFDSINDIIETNSKGK